MSGQGGRQPRLLDLFCGAGGAGTGYARAGFDVVGVDIKPQPHYPFEFHQGDAMTWPLDGFDAIHASPPCQDHSPMSAMHDKHGTGWMVAATLERLADRPEPWVVENVVGAPLASQPTFFGTHGLVLCGSMFGLSTTVDGIEYGLRRHRLFESNITLIQPSCGCRRLPTVGVYGHGESKSVRDERGFQVSTADARRDVMDMPWANRDEIAQAIPPAYTEHIGLQLIQHLSMLEVHR